MAAIKIEIEFSDLRHLLTERDQLLARIAELESKPLEFSLEKLARDVLDEGTGPEARRRGYGLTPDQREGLRAAIKRGGRPAPKES